MLDPFNLLPGRFRQFVWHSRGHVGSGLTECDVCGAARVLLMRGDWPTAVVCVACDRIDLALYRCRSMVLSRQDDRP